MPTSWVSGYHHTVRTEVGDNQITSDIVRSRQRPFRLPICLTTARIVALYGERAR